MSRIFAIGDVHGHVDRLEKLLAKAGVTKDDTVVQLGDLGNFGRDATQDYECYALARDNKFIVLWGNHDRAVVSNASWFRGYTEPNVRLHDLMFEVAPRWFHKEHGVLFTHAGLHPAYVKYHPSDEYPVFSGEPVNENASIFTDIGPYRGGMARQGGILWRDAREPLWNGIVQVFGHTRGAIRRYHEKSYCIDVGDKYNGNLAGMWIPDFKVVAVGPDADEFETTVMEE